MTAISTAVDLNRVSAITGYEIKAALKAVRAGNLPQRIIIIAESNTLNQLGLPDTLNFTTANEVGSIAGNGSPAYLIARILRPYSGDLLGGIPTIWIPVAEAAGATVTTQTIAITGTATANATHTVKLAGRTQLDGSSYSFSIETGDVAADIAQKIIDAVNSVIGSPAVGTLSTDDAVLTSKWKGLTSSEMDCEIEVNGKAAGISYAVTASAGSGSPSIATSLAKIGNEWGTMVINGLNGVSDVLDELEAFNGNANDRTGRYEPTVFKPFVSFFGSRATLLADYTSLTGARKNEMTNVVCPAPNSSGFSFEAAANGPFIYAPIVQNTPQTDPIGRLYPDMPAASDIGDFANTSKRDQIVKIGSSTVKLNSEQYEIVDLVTTYHPDNEPITVSLFRWVRDIAGIDFNIKYGYALLENIHVIGKTIVNDDSTSTAENTISPSRWKAILYAYADDLENRALIASAKTMKDTLQVQKGETNPDRFETSFDVERTATARVLSTTNRTTLNFG